MTTKRKDTGPSLLHKGQEITIDIDNIGSDGQGIGRYEGLAVFVPETLPGEQVKARVTLVKKSFAVAAPLSIDKTSPDRVEPVCPVYELCGGCQLQHLSYEGELRMKTRQVEDALTRIGHLTDVKVLPTLRNDHPQHYRNKMQIPVAGGKGKLCSDLYGYPDAGDERTRRHKSHTQAGGSVGVFHSDHRHDGGRVRGKRYGVHERRHERTYRKADRY